MQGEPRETPAPAGITLKAGEQLRILAGMSMYPLLKPGWIIIHSPATAANLEPGDLAVFRCGTGLQCHRLLGKWPQRRPVFIVQKGDHDHVAMVAGADSAICRVLAVYDRKGEPVDLCTRQLLCTPKSLHRLATLCVCAAKVASRGVGALKGIILGA